MKRLTSLAGVLMLSALLAMPAVAGRQQQDDNKDQKKFDGSQHYGQQQVPHGHVRSREDSVGRSLHKAYFLHLAERMSKVSTAEDERTRNISNNSPGNTGL